MKIKQALKMVQTQILKVKPESISFKGDIPVISDVTTRENLELVAQRLKETSEVVGFPTETVYGLGGSALNDQSVKNIYQAKNRPADNPLIVHISLIDQLRRKILPQGYDIPIAYHGLLEQFWPGPLTILLPNDPTTSPLSQYVTAGQDTFAVRMPRHPVARALIALSDTPLAAPSANALTRPSPTQAQHVFHDLLGKIPFILDGGSCDVGLESTVVDGLSNPPMLLRPGGVSAEQIQKYGGAAWTNMVKAKKTAAEDEKVRTPGMKYRHYSPTAKVVLFVGCNDGEKAVHKYLDNVDEGAKIALLSASSFKPAGELLSRITIERSMGKDGAEILRNMFAMLREVDELGVDLILVEGVEENNEGLAVMNRLLKAAQEVINGD